MAVGDDAPWAAGTLGRTFHYCFRLVALNAVIDAPPAFDWHQVEKMVEGHVIEEAELHASYTRRA